MRLFPFGMLCLLAVVPLLHSCGPMQTDAASESSVALTWSFANAGGTSPMNKDSTKSGSYPVLATFNSKLYAAFVETNGTKYQLRLKESSDGTTWSFADGNGTTGLNKDTAMDADRPTLLATSSKLYLAWNEGDVNTTVNQVRVKESSNGSTWSFIDGGAATGLNADAANQNAYAPTLAVFSSNLYAAWYESDGTAEQIRVKKYDGTSSWSFVDGGSLNKNTSMVADGRPSLAVFNSKLYAAWEEVDATGSKYQIRVKSYDGSSWTFVDGNGVYGLNYDTSKGANNPQLIVFNSKLYLIWQESNGSKAQIRAKSYNGTTWTTADANTSLNIDSTKEAIISKAAIFNSKLYVAWQEPDSSKSQIRVRGFNGSSWAVADGGLTTGLNATTTDDAVNVELAVFGSKLYAVWREVASGVSLIRIKAGQ